MQEEKALTEQNRPLAIYVHVPFCKKHCAYCDFNTYVEKAQSALVDQTVEAICRDIERAAAEMDGRTPLGTRPVPTVFFGGGTPTFLSGEQLAHILDVIRANFAVAPDAEISSEANPGSSDAEKFAAMRAAGFNRLSIGVQSFDDALLMALDRFHTAGEAERALQAAREAGFANINLDLMFGLPQQTLPLWEATLERALALRPAHLSLYALTLEPGTRFERLHAGGKLDLPDEETELAMYERCIAALTAAGYAHYEVSNFAQPGFRCQHNQVYWRNEEYLGVGPGAVSYIAGRRWKRERLPLRYVQKVNAGADLSVESECLDIAGALGETMMLGLRMREGLPLQRLRDRFGIEPRTYFAAQIEKLTARGLLVLEEDTLRLTHRGLLLANDVLGEFLPET
ncbi:MAG TPA: radical SAM family heme chaperone HemW [Chthonomonadaceae bacterium]|nr:radical SAM family heme chaperone HemW [Chthonomonadaceae bacterium]